MFGYIRVDKPELKIKEYEIYKAVYCSLCRKLGKSYGVFARFTLSYDFTFLALLNMSLDDGCQSFKKGVCPFNPLKKCNYCKNDDRLVMPSAVAMIMLYYKLADNVNDEKGFKKFGYFLLKLLFSHGYKKTAKTHPRIEKIVSNYIKEQNELEKQSCDELDRAADPTAVALGKIFSLCSDDDTQKRILDRLGYCIGRYIYILDAVCDLEEDKKKKRYNVFSFKECDNLKEHTTEQLYFCINEAINAFELLDIKKYKSILVNILYLGLENTFKKELYQ